MLNYDMTSFMRSCVERYKALCPGVKLRRVDEPFLEENQTQAPMGRPLSDGKFVECEWCQHTFTPVKTYKNENELLSDIKAR